MATATASASARSAHHSTPVQVLGRVGMVCYGAVYFVVAILAFQVAFGERSGGADQNGALSEIASTPFGMVTMWLLAVGLIAFGVWQGLMAAFSYQWHDGKKRLRKRLSAGVRAVTGLSLGIAAIGIATGSGGGGSSDQKPKEFTATLMEVPFGQILVGLVALAVIGFGIGSVVSGIKGSFMQDLNSNELPNGSRKWVERVGRVGYIAKGTSVALVGVLIGIAAIDANPQEAGGLDSALRALAEQPFGPYLLVAMALGFAAFGLYCLPAAKAQRT